jgi:uncharacterized surface protein with fasciclin (FAS1) repeats
MQPTIAGFIENDDNFSIFVAALNLVNGIPIDPALVDELFRTPVEDLPPPPVPTGSPVEPTQAPVPAPTQTAPTPTQPVPAPRPVPAPTPPVPTAEPLFQAPQEFGIFVNGVFLEVTTDISRPPNPPAVFIGNDPNPTPPTPECVPTLFRICPGRRLQVGTPDGLYPKAPLAPDSGPADRRRLVINRVNLLNILDDADGDFTLFAPTNNAFRFLPRELRVLLFTRPDNAFLPHLEDLVLYHALATGRLESDFMMIEDIQAFNSEGLRIRTNPFRVQGTSVSPDRDLSFTNGVTHVIRRVLRPDWVDNSILGFVASSMTDLSTLFGLLVLADLDDNLDQFGDGLTLVAPTNNAFAALGDAVLNSLSQQDLINILEYHIITGVFASPELSLLDGARLPTEQGTPIEVSVIVSLGTRGVDITEFMLNNQANVLVSIDGRDSILANNGVLYKIDAVLRF